MTPPLVLLGFLVITLVLFIFDREMMPVRYIVLAFLLFAGAVSFDGYGFLEPVGISPQAWDVVILITGSVYTAMILTWIGRGLLNRRKAGGEQVSKQA